MKHRRVTTSAMSRATRSGSWRKTRCANTSSSELLARTVRSCCTESSATTRPSWRTMTRVQSFSTTSRMCDVYRIALPRAARFATRWREHERGGHVEPCIGLIEDEQVRIVEERTDTRIFCFIPFDRRRSLARRHRTARTARGARQSCDPSRMAAFRAVCRPAGAARGQTGTGRDAAPPEHIRGVFELDRVEPGLAAVEEDTAPVVGSSRPSGYASWSSCRMRSVRDSRRPLLD